MYSFEKFKQSKWSLVILTGDQIQFRSKAKAITPLRRFLSSYQPGLTDLIIYDKYIGRAAALLMAVIKPSKVFTPVISEGGKATLIEHEIPFEAEREVKYLMGIASDDMCHWEKMSLGKSPKEFLAMLEDAE